VKQLTAFDNVRQSNSSVPSGQWYSVQSQRWDNGIHVPSPHVNSSLLHLPAEAAVVVVPSTDQRTTQTMPRDCKHLSVWFEVITRIPSGIWSRLYGWIVTTWLLWMCVPRIGSFPWPLNTWSKVLTLNPYMSLLNLKLCTHIWSTNIFRL